MGPTPCAFTIHHMKKVIPAVGATMAFKVKRWRLGHILISNIQGKCMVKKKYILWIGNQMAGREINQKRKKHMKSLVVVPEDAGR